MDWIAFAGIMSGILISLGFFALIGYFVWLEYKKKQLQNQQILKAIEKGVDIPELHLGKKPVNNLGRGLILFFFGLALTFALWISAGHEGGVWGLLFVGLGIAYFIIYLIEKKKEKE
ncbi:MAG: DUF6249 domain-containing protein [Candidatus Marinimicrobia bacterium]|nr:DUF6249 domain-containing protein [Candidatus Neomarinimicrobiota bacterium]